MEIESFLAAWLGKLGGAERSNAQMFFCDLCSLLEVPRPTPALNGGLGDYVFERAVRLRPSEGEGVYGWIDLYKRGCFILEAKQSRMTGGDKRPPGLACGEDDAQTSPRRGRRLESRGWDKLMRNARGQAESYVDHLPSDHVAPPFLLVCDVGHMLEVYADFSGAGRNYTYFPDRQGYRVFLEDLRQTSTRERLQAIWTDPHSLDPARRRGRATREIARNLALVSERLEAAGKDAGEVALFLMRCIFTMFACSVGLLPERGFADMLDSCRNDPGRFAAVLHDAWVKMNDPIYEGRFVPDFNAHTPLFGGRLFKGCTMFTPDEPTMAALREAAACSWAEVEPAIFGTLLETALDEEERRRLGAHYTPRAHVERLVQATVMEPLRKDWAAALSKIDRLREVGDLGAALRRAQAFHHSLRRIRVLDPACGTGNFLYVALELMKSLEAEVLETLVQLGATETLATETIDPRQFLGLEVNPRAAVIAELVLWIGFLQLHYRTHSGHPGEPILQAYDTIVHRDALLDWYGWPTPSAEPRDGVRVETLPRARQPDWPEAEFIVGNPPFLGGKDLRARLGDLYTEALWAAHPQMNRGADLVMYWWDQAAERLTREGSPLRRFGLVTTNSLSQTFQRQTLERHLGGARPIHLTLAAPDHPWTRATPDAAAVRVAMTVAEAGVGEGVQLSIASETTLEGDEPRLEFHRATGRIHSDLSIGVDLTAARPLQANRGLCSPGVKLHGAGFIVSAQRARDLGLGRRAGLEDYVRPYLNGRDVVQSGREAWVIDLYPLSAEVVRARFPEVYQHLLATVKPHRDANRMAFRREHWWWFGATHEMYRSFTAGLTRYIATPETAKHRLFVFVPAAVRADNMLVNFGLAEAFHLGVLSARPHLVWAAATGAVLEDRPRYTKSSCFDPYPFPEPADALRHAIAEAAEELEATRVQVRAEAPELTLTRLYNALAALRRGEAVEPQAMAHGRVLILREMHDRLDALVLQAYGWPQGIANDELLSRLAELNRERRAAEDAGEVRWLRPDYQLQRFGRTAGSPSLGSAPAARTSAVVAQTPRFPRHPDEQSAAVLQALSRLGRPATAAEAAACFTSRRADLLVLVEKAMTVLAQYGHLSMLEDGRFLARRAA